MHTWLCLNVFGGFLAAMRWNRTSQSHKHFTHMTPSVLLPTLSSHFPSQQCKVSMSPCAWHAFRCLWAFAHAVSSSWNAWWHVASPSGVSSSTAFFSSCRIQMLLSLGSHRVCTDLALLYLLHWTVLSTYRPVSSNALSLKSETYLFLYACCLSWCKHSVSIYWLNKYINKETTIFFSYRNLYTSRRYP